MEEKEKHFYSKVELEEFKEIILAKLDEALAEKQRLSESLKNVGGGSVDSFNITEFGNESQEKEQNEILLARQNKFILNLKNALIRIENGTYGICKDTGKLIPKERLRLVHHQKTTNKNKMKEK